jgi:hypothetical protein
MKELKKICLLRLVRECCSCLSRNCPQPLKELADALPVRAGLNVKPPDVTAGYQAGAQRNAIQFRCSVGG